ncbi:MAG TPA: hypothetical protein VEV43_03470, partial [Actinomycetota bacterium]|nr:hypothetical protein [Actinomycetota bacterium]
DVVVGTGIDRVEAGTGDDTIHDVDNFDCRDAGCSREPDDTFDGGAGNDWILYEGSLGVTVDLTNGTATGAGADAVTELENVVGTEQADTILGDEGPNHLRSGGGGDYVEGRGGDDELVDAYNHGGVSDGDEIHGGEGDDRLSSLSGTSSLHGEDGDDRILGGAGADAIEGGAGNDVVVGSGADDTIDGGDGSDTIDFTNTFLKVNLDLASGTGEKLIGSFDTLFGTDAYVSIENATGSDKNDTLRGDDGPNALSGGPGSDSIEGRSGDDVIDAGEGMEPGSSATERDVADGGPGTDTCTNAEEATGCEA